MASTGSRFFLATFATGLLSLAVSTRGVALAQNADVYQPPGPGLTLGWSCLDGFTDRITDIALDPGLAVIVCGNRSTGAQIRKLEAFTGDTAWTLNLGATSAEALVVDEEGASLFMPDVVTAKYSAEGVLPGTQRHDGTAQSHDTPRDIAATSDGGCVVVGTTEPVSSGADPLVVRYGPDGTLHWLFDKGTNGGESARAVVLDPAGNTYVIGSTFTSENGFDVLALSLGADGRRDWQLRWDGGEGRGAGGHAIALEDHRHVLVAAHSYHWWTENDVTTLVADAQRGKVLASAFFDGPLSRHDTPLAIVADPGGGVFVGGFANGAYPYEDALVLRYDLNLP